MPRAFSHCSAVTPVDSKWEAGHFDGAKGGAKHLFLSGWRFGVAVCG